MNARRWMKVLFFCGLLSAGCSRDRAPLPGDSVAADGAVSLEPGRVPTTPAAPPSREAPNPVEGALFAPELVMAHQNAIGLTPAQRETIAKEVERTHGELLGAQWELDSAKERLVTVLGEPRVDEAKSKEAAAAVMKQEIAIKTGHLAMLVRIKNVLTPEQQTKLAALRDAERCAR